MLACCQEYICLSIQVLIPSFPIYAISLSYDFVLKFILLNYSTFTLLVCKDACNYFYFYFLLEIFVSNSKAPTLENVPRVHRGMSTQMLLLEGDCKEPYLY